MFKVGQFYDLQYVIYGEDGADIETDFKWECVAADGVVAKFVRNGEERIINASNPTFAGARPHDGKLNTR